MAALRTCLLLSWKLVMKTIKKMNSTRTWFKVFNWPMKMNFFFLGFEVDLVQEKLEH
jgi:hypothetical protein